MWEMLSKARIRLASALSSLLLAVARWRPLGQTFMAMPDTPPRDDAPDRSGYLLALHQSLQVGFLAPLVAQVALLVEDL